MIGENLRKYRVNKVKLSQREVADNLGVDRNTYASWENNESDVKSEFILKIAHLFDVKISDLFTQETSVPYIMQTHNEGKDNSILNGAIIIFSDKQTVNKLFDLVTQNIQNHRKDSEKPT
jgi:DNA-binding XRE family transcriptional regulator